MIKNISNIKQDKAKGLKTSESSQSFDNLSDTENQRFSVSQTSNKQKVQDTKKGLRSSLAKPAAEQNNKFGGQN